MHRLLHTLTSIAFATGLSLIAPACQGLPGMASEPKLAVFEWHRSPTFEFGARAGKTVYVHWNNPAAASEFDQIPDMLEGIAAERGFALADDLTEADYVCCASLRFFGLNPHADGGAALAEVNEVIEPGYPGWWIVGQGVDTSDHMSNTTIKLPTLAGGKLRPSEWAVVLDLAVGERRPTAQATETGSAEPGTPENPLIAASASAAAYFRREGRLFGYVRGDLDRAKAATALNLDLKKKLGEALPYQRKKKSTTDASATPSQVEPAGNPPTE